MEESQKLKTQIQKLEHSRENLQELLGLDIEKEVLPEQVEPPPGFAPLRPGHDFIPGKAKNFPNTVFGTVVCTNAGATEEWVRKDRGQRRKVQKKLYDNLDKHHPSNAQRKAKRQEESQPRRKHDDKPSTFQPSIERLLGFDQDNYCTPITFE